MVEVPKHRIGWQFQQKVPGIGWRNVSRFETSHVWWEEHGRTTVPWRKPPWKQASHVWPQWSQHVGNSEDPWYLMTSSWYPSKSSKVRVCFLLGCASQVSSFITKWNKPVMEPPVIHTHIYIYVYIYIHISYMIYMIYVYNMPLCRRNKHGSLIPSHPDCRQNPPAPRSLGNVGEGVQRRNHREGKSSVQAMFG